MPVTQGESNRRRMKGNSPVYGRPKAFLNVRLDNENRGRHGECTIPVSTSRYDRGGVTLAVVSDCIGRSDGGHTTTGLSEHGWRIYRGLHMVVPCVKRGFLLWLE